MHAFNEIEPVTTDSSRYIGASLLIDGLIGLSSRPEGVAEKDYETAIDLLILVIFNKKYDIRTCIKSLATNSYPANQTGFAVAEQHLGRGLPLSKALASVSNQGLLRIDPDVLDIFTKADADGTDPGEACKLAAAKVIHRAFGVRDVWQLWPAWAPQGSSTS